MPDIPIHPPRQPWDEEDDQGRRGGAAVYQLAATRYQPPGSQSSQGPYQDFDQFAAQQERNNGWLIDLDPSTPTSFGNTSDNSRQRPRAMPSLIDLDIDDAIPDDFVSEAETVCCEQCENEG